MLWSVTAVAQPIRLRLSTENAPGHVQTRIVQGFVDRVVKATGERLVIDFRHSAQLFRDADVVRAMRQGQVEMAVPGLWQLDRAEPAVSVFFLPAFYGRDTAATNLIRDGPIGAEIGRRAEESLKVKVLGRWIDLGFAHVFTAARSLRRLDDLAGLRIRLAGGDVNLWRFRALGALPQIVPWPDVPRALSTGGLDGLVTTYESVDSARLDRQGVANVLETRDYFAQYVPIVARPAWDRLPSDLQTVLVESWEAGVDAARRLAGEAQAAAKARLVADGLRVAAPAPEDIAATRRRLSLGQDDLARALGVDPSLVRAAERAMERAP